MNLIETPTAEAWVMPPGNLLITTVTEAGETAITLTCTVHGVVDVPARRSSRRCAPWRWRRSTWSPSSGRGGEPWTISA